ncbi:hypothetical protein U1Q18_001265 [Sarracenia purpurea var. burkii]
MRTSLRSQEIRNAWDLSPEIHHPPQRNRRPRHLNLHLLQADPYITRRVPGDRLRRRALRLRPHPPDIRLRRQLPHPKVSASAEHRRAERLHSGGDAGPAPGAELGADLPAGTGFAGRGADVELVVVGDCDCSVCLHSVEREVQDHLGWVQRPGVLRLAEFFQVIGCVGGDAVPGDLVLSDSSFARWVA